MSIFENDADDSRSTPAAIYLHRLFECLEWGNTTLIGAAEAAGISVGGLYQGPLTTEQINRVEKSLGAYKGHLAGGNSEINDAFRRANVQWHLDGTREAVKDLLSDCTIDVPAIDICKYSPAGLAEVRSEAAALIEDLAELRIKLDFRANSYRLVLNEIDQQQPPPDDL